MNQKVNSVVGIIIILIIAVTAGVFTWRWQKSEREITEALQATKMKKQAVDDKSNRSSANKYLNKELGFEFDYPSSWEKFKIKENINRDETGTYSIEYYMPIANKDVWIFSVGIFPIEQWSSDRCKNVQTMCEVGKKIGQNNKYVFESDLPFLISDPCKPGDENFINDKQFCSVYRDMEKDNFIGNHFRTFNPGGNITENKKYQNTKYGFEFQVPSDWIVSDNYNDYGFGKIIVELRSPESNKEINDFINSGIVGEGPVSDFIVTYFDSFADHYSKASSEPSKNLEDYVKNSGTVSQMNQITFAGQKAWFIMEEGYMSTPVIIFEYKGHLFSISMNHLPGDIKWPMSVEKLPLTEREIVSSFKLLN